ncbi:hypothetical protein ACLKA6_007583 [Drosophila palustris]
MEKPRANKRKEKKEKSNHAIKIVVRHLPPTMTEQEFLEQVDPLPENDSYYYCPADWSLGQEATCRAYIDMSLKDISEVLQFRDRFDGYVFVDSKGAEYVAIVEYAPFQCFMKNKARNHDNKVNTIEKESHYQDFLQKLAEEREEAIRLGDLKIDIPLESRSDEKVKSTPLLQYLANKKEKRREEARKRNEEKRKQREEQKLLKSMDAPENSKPKDAAGENKKPLNNNNQKSNKDINKEGQAADKSAKNSRSKRRTERDQRRREEHEQRKLARDREQRDKKNDRNENPEKDNNSNKKSSKQTNQSKEQQSISKEVTILKKEAKADSNLAVSNTDTDKSAEACSERLASSQDNKGVTKTAPKSTEPGSQSEARKSANRRSAAERRIRNKDRPSIAIYQPKARNRLGSEENSPNDCKDSSRTTEMPVFPTEADGNPLPDEKSKNKRFGRRNKQKPQGSKESTEHARCVSKSSESSTSAHSTLK